MFRKNVYILGAGFSANAGAPVMLDFLKRAKELRDDTRLGLPENDKETFGRVFQRLYDLRVAQARMVIDIENIEHLFSLLDMDIEFGGVSTKALRSDLILLILRTLEKTIRVENLRLGPHNLKMRSHNYNMNVQANFVELFSALASRCWIGGDFGIPGDGHCQDAIITMNYDCLVDDSLVRIGIQPDYGLEHTELPGQWRQSRRMSILKLHGSANWFRCSSEDCRDRTWINPDTPSKRLEYFYGAGCSHCHRQIEPIIVPPTWAKGGQSEVLRPVWARALQALRQAGRIFVIGYSMPSTDEFFRYMLALALAANEHLDKVIIVNPSNEAQATFAKLFQEQFRLRKLIQVQQTIEAYIHSLGNELEQFQYGFEKGLVEVSRIPFSV